MLKNKNKYFVSAPSAQQVPQPPMGPSDEDQGESNQLR
jgi:hypothetical protein